MKSNEFLYDLLDLIKENKNYPSYQAERRIDIFINLFLIDILKSIYPNSYIKFIAPEFPLKKDNNQSTKLDYLCYRSEGDIKEILFIELKTDADSFDEGQYKTYLDYKKNKTWKDCIENLGRIAASKGMPYSKRNKYFHLISSLIKHDLLKCDENHFNSIEIIMDQERNSNNVNEKKKLKGLFTKQLKLLIKNITLSEDYNIEVIYLAPASIREKVDQVELIAFDELNPDLVSEYPAVWRQLLAILQ